MHFYNNNKNPLNQVFKRQTASLSLPGARNYPQLICLWHRESCCFGSYSSILNFIQGSGEREPWMGMKNEWDWARGRGRWSHWLVEQMLLGKIVRSTALRIVHGWFRQTSETGGHAQASHLQNSTSTPAPLNSAGLSCRAPGNGTDSDRCVLRESVAA